MPLPRTIDEQKFRDPQRTTFDVSAPANSPTGIPHKEIPVMEFPRCVYKWPTEPFKLKVYRNTHHEIVHEEMVATEHESKVVQNAEELAKALKAGWVKEPYIPKSVEELEAAKEAKAR